MLPNWFGRFGEHPATGTERGFEFAYDGVDAQRLHRPDRTRPARVRHAHHRLQDRRHVQQARRRTRACSSASTTSAAQEAEDLKEVGVITGVELAYLKGHYKTGDIEMREWEVGSGEREAEYQQRMRERLSALIARAPPPGRRGAVPAELAGRLLLLRLQDALLALSAGRAVVLDGRWIVTDRVVPARDRRRHGRPRADRRAVASDLVAARAVRARRRSGIGQDVRDGRARGVPGARRHRPLEASRRRQGVLPGNVLCLTFTNKATENLQHRIRRALASWTWRRARSPRS